MKRVGSFKERVLKVVCSIPKGEAYSYKQVAWASGSPNAFRAVARIMATNTDPHVPCHRVIRSDGTVGGYGHGGEDTKRKLLLEEGVVL